MPNWVTFDKYATPTPGEPFVTIQRGGKLITLNGAAYRALESPEAVELLYDPDERLVGLRPADSRSARAYIVRQMAKSTSTHTIAGAAFVQHWGIDTSIALRYPAYMDDGCLVIDLKQKGADVTGVRSRIKGAAGLRSRYKGPTPK